ncbi:alanine and glycine-rich protein-like [Schistocerca piceifrons]|uniref:alanine and glycine-rich protein-like n=1 Tax=Schistocerca piceifrons TaxID=274613 RepID=UPI001F5FB7F0|nr:alanine and glycine-rich protein-like [Schistocerca piceifrons]
MQGGAAAVAAEAALEPAGGGWSPLEAGGAVAARAQPAERTGPPLQRSSGPGSSGKVNHCAGLPAHVPLRCSSGGGGGGGGGGASSSWKCGRHDRPD